MKRRDSLSNDPSQPGHLGTESSATHGFRRRSDFDQRFDALFEIAERIARRIVSPQDAEDVAIETLTKVLVRWSKLRDADYLAAWVSRVAFNEALDVWRKQRSRNSAELTEPVSRDESDAVVERMALGEALARLSKRQREVIALRYLADLSQDQTARELRISTGAVAQHAHRGLESQRCALGASLEFGLENDA